MASNAELITDRNLERLHLPALEASLDAAQIRQKPEAPFREAKQAVDLGQAERIVAVGRGIKSQENIALAERLAKAMNAEVAASRPICDNGWLPMERQVGSSGQTVAPKVYMALGISGAIQHLVGMKGSRTIVAINKDAEAPIFQIAAVRPVLAWSERHAPSFYLAFFVLLQQISTIFEDSRAIAVSVLLTLKQLF